jgi:hypothetical protein
MHKTRNLKALLIIRRVHNGKIQRLSIKSWTARAWKNLYASQSLTLFFGLSNDQHDFRKLGCLTLIKPCAHQTSPMTRDLYHDTMPSCEGLVFIAPSTRSRVKRRRVLDRYTHHELSTTGAPAASIYDQHRTNERSESSPPSAHRQGALVAREAGQRNSYLSNELE